MTMMKTILFSLALSVGISLAAVALEPNDVILMVQNGVEDSAIINMVQSQKLSRPLNAQEVLTLNASGASPAILEFLTRPGSSVESYVVTEPITVVEPSPIVVSPQPNVIVTPPSTVYYDATYYSYPYYSSPYSYGPSYRRPFYFGFSWNDNHRWRDHRPSHRPPSFRPHPGGGRPPSGRPGGGPGGRPGGGPRPGGGGGHGHGPGGRGGPGPRR